MDPTRGDIGDGCGQDRDCNGHLRCLANRCALPGQDLRSHHGAEQPSERRTRSNWEGLAASVGVGYGWLPPGALSGTALGTYGSLPLSPLLHLHSVKLGIPWYGAFTNLEYQAGAAMLGIRLGERYYVDGLLGVQRSMSGVYETPTGSMVITSGPTRVSEIKTAFAVGLAAGTHLDLTADRTPTWSVTPHVFLGRTARYEDVHDAAPWLLQVLIGLTVRVPTVEPTMDGKASRL